MYSAYKRLKFSFFVLNTILSLLGLVTLIAGFYLNYVYINESIVRDYHFTIGHLLCSAITTLILALYGWYIINKQDSFKIKVYTIFGFLIFCFFIATIAHGYYSLINIKSNQMDEWYKKDFDYDINNGTNRPWIDKLQMTSECCGFLKATVEYKNGIPWSCCPKYYPDKSNCVLENYYKSSCKVKLFSALVAERKLILVTQVFLAVLEVIAASVAFAAAKVIDDARRSFLGV